MARSYDYEAEDVLEVGEPAQLRALGDSLRTKIVMLVRDKAYSTTELAEALGLPKSTVAHHVKVLEKAGLLRVVRTRQVRALTERYYGRTARLFVIKSTDELPADVPTSNAFAALSLRQAADEVAAAPEEPMTVSIAHARVAEKDARRFMRRLDRLVEEFRARDSEGASFGLAVGLYPYEPPR